MKNLIYLFFSILFLSCQNSQKSRVSTKDFSSEEIVSSNVFLKKATENKESVVDYQRQDRLTSISRPFVINDIKCYWEFKQISYKGASGGDGLLNLKSSNTGNILLSHTDYYDLDFFDSVNNDNSDFNGEFRDANFDGLKDFIVYSRMGSGSGGSAFKVFLFEKKENIFELSKELSGGEFEINEKDRTVSTYWKMGIGLNSRRVHHFEKDGKIKFTASTSRELIPQNETTLLKTTYEKVVGGQLIERTIDTTTFEGYK